MPVTVHITINGKPVESAVPVQRTLADYVRYDLGLTGTKESCGVGVCGACTVLRDGKMIAACITLAADCDGADLTTVEGLAHNGDLDPVQRAFIQHGGFQCGICTPGQVVAARALLNEVPHPTEEQIKEWMAGNLCRCTGYYGIIRSVRAAAEASRG